MCLVQGLWTAPHSTQHKMAELKDAIKVNTDKDSDTELGRLVVMVSKALTMAKKENRPVFVLPNYKFKSEKEAVQFSALAPAVLEKATKEVWHVCRMMTGHEGHLVMALGYGMTYEAFMDAMNGLDQAKSCDACGKECVPSKCGGCGKARYCGKECQKSDWKNHKEECKKFSDEYKKWKLSVA